MTATLFVNARLPEGGLSDISVENGVIVSIEPRGERTAATVADGSRLVVDLESRLVVPLFVEPHAHLDKAYLSERMENQTGDLMGAIDALQRHRSSLTVDDIADRAERAARRLASHGVGTIRTHVDTTLEGGLTPLLGLIEARRRCGDIIEIEIAALLGWQVAGSGAKEILALARDALRAGADVIGGCPHLDDDPVGAVDALVDLALEWGVSLDLHADENLRPESDDLGSLARRILRDGLTLSANASHCVSLSIKDPATQARIADDVAAAGVTVTVLPQTNLFLQSHGVTSSPPRAIAPVALLRSAGVTVAAGGDNLQDPFNPLGSGDPLESAALCVWATHVNPDVALRMVTSDAASCLARRQTLETGKRADFVALRATSVREAIAERPSDRTVVQRGVIVGR